MCTCFITASIVVAVMVKRWIGALKPVHRIIRFRDEKER